MDIIIAALNTIRAQCIEMGYLQLATSIDAILATCIKPPSSKYDWSSPVAARHSLRVICDEEGLTVDEKNTMSRVIHCESGYLTGITHPNLDHNGLLHSTDYGICQWNDKYHGKEIPPADALHDPEKAVRLMCQYVKTGKINQWVCYSTGMYLSYSA